MSLPFSLDVALRYLRPHRTFLSVVTVLSVVGVGLGVMIMIIVLSVMSGFGELWRDTILAFAPHLTVRTFDPLDDPDEVVEILEAHPEVVAAAPFIEGPGFISVEDTAVGVMVRGVDPAHEGRLSQVPEKVVAGRFDLDAGGVVMGHRVARSAGVGVGDTITVYSPATFGRPGQIRLPEDFRVTGLFDMGMLELDAGYMMIGLVEARDLFGLREGVHGIQVKIRDPEPVAAFGAARDLRRLLGPGFHVETWMDQHQQLFRTLQTEKSLMAFLLLFISIVASFCITITLLTIVVQKTREIGLLKAVGHRPGTIVMVFVWQGWIQGVIGTAAGLGAGLVALHYRNDVLAFLRRRLGYDVFPAEFYHFNELPAQTSPADVALIAVSVLVLCTVAGLLPAWRAAMVDPAQALRND